ncbi:putative ribonuclease H-like domain-containing protein [Tanacetum coccineum]
MNTLTFSHYSDAKTSLLLLKHDLEKSVSRLAILGVVITQEDLNSKKLRSLPPEWNTHVVVWMNKEDIETMSIDDLYNNFKIVEQDVKKSVSASSGAQNLAFMTTPSTSSTNDVNTANPAYEVSTVSSNINTTCPQVSTANFSDNTVYDFMVENPNGSNLLQLDLEQIYEDDLEAMDLKWQLSLLSMREKVLSENIARKSSLMLNIQLAPRKTKSQFRYQDNTMKQGNKEDTSLKAMLAINGVGFDWSNIAEEQFEKVKQEKDGSEFKIKKFNNALKSLDKLLGRQITDKSKKGLGYNVVPPSYPLIYNRPTKLDLSYSGLDEFKDPEFKSYGSEVSKKESNVVCDKKSDDSKENPDNSLVKEQVSKDTSSFVESSLNVDKETVFPIDKKVESVKPKNYEKPVKSQLGVLIMYMLSVNTIKGKGWFTHKVNTDKAKAVNTARPKAVKTARPNSTVVNAIRGKPQQDDTGFVDSGCSRHMTGNIAYLSDFKEFDGGYVTFGGGAHGGRISGKGTLKTDSLDFEDVYFVNELKFNLFSVSQMCDKKNYVLFTDTECLVLSPNFKLPDENQILLKIPRKDNMYSFDMKNIVPKESLTCLVAKATLDESMLWHRRLGKKHRASCKSKVLNPITKPLFMLHMDLFGPTFVSSLMHKKYCLVVTDDYSRFTWVFFLTTKDETSEILKNFIKEIENLVDKKVKIIRSDNGTEFKNKVMDDFCREKGIKREYSVARTPQQNGVAERRNRTLIEAARTMLADSKLPTTFWAEAVSTACYVHNMVVVVKPHNKTPYELFRGFKPALSFMKPFGCHVTILNTLDSLGKFDGKSDEGFFVGYSLSSKAFRVYNTRTRRVEENLHIVAAGTIINESAGTQEELNAGTSEEISQDCTVKDGLDNENDEKEKSNDDSSSKEVNAVGQHVTTASSTLEATHVEFFSDEDEPKVDLGNITNSYTVWILVDLPIGKRAIGTKWVFRNKKDERGIVIRNKARLVAQGHRQEEGIDYAEFCLMWHRIEAINVLAMLILWFLDLKILTIQTKFTRWSRHFMVCIKHQEHAEILKKFNYINVKSASTLVDLEKPLVKDRDVDDVDVHLYRYMIGSLMYLTASRPDIIYLKGKPTLGLWYLWLILFELVAYTDSDYIGATQDKKSTTGGCQFLGNRLISWQCKKQTVVATSITEAEYVAAASCCGQLVSTASTSVSTSSRVSTVSNLLTKGFDAGRFQYLVSSKASEYLMLNASPLKNWLRKS